MHTLIEAQNLLKRYREGTAFRYYVEERMPLVMFAVVVFLGYSLATTAATIVFVGGTHGFLTFMAMVFAPVLLIGSLAVLLFVFFSWLETRAMGTAARRSTVDLRHIRSMPALRSAVERLPVPWLFAGLFIVLPFIVTLLLSAKTALALLVGAAIAPTLFSLLDR
jgi:hypothetical protein